MIELLGIACVAWTVFELVRLARQTPALVRPHGPHRRAAASRSAARPHRPPLAAWDEEGRPICVEDVAFRNVRST